MFSIQKSFSIKLYKNLIHTGEIQGLDESFHFDPIYKLPSLSTLFQDGRQSFSFCLSNSWGDGRLNFHSLRVQAVKKKILIKNLKTFSSALSSYFFDFLITFRINLFVL